MTTVRGFIHDVLGTSITDIAQYTITLTSESLIRTGEDTDNTIIVPFERTVTLAADGLFEEELDATTEINGIYILTIRTGGMNPETIAELKFSVPESDEPVQLNSLVSTPLQGNFLNTSLRYLAELIASDSNLLAIFAGGLRPRGNYDNTAFYSYLDTVAFDGSSWVNLSRIPISNVTPGTDDTIWQVVSQRGDTGVGTGQGVNTAYDEVTWSADTVAPPTRSAVSGEVEVLRSLSNSKVSADSPTMSGTVAVPTNSNIGDISASTQFVDDNYASIADEFLQGNVRATTRNRGTDNTQLATTAFVQAEKPYGAGLYGLFGSTLNNEPVATSIPLLKNGVKVNGSPAVSLNASTNEIEFNEAGVYIVVVSVQTGKATGVNDVQRFDVTLNSSNPVDIASIMRPYYNNASVSTVPNVTSAPFLMVVNDPGSNLDVTMELQLAGSAGNWDITTFVRISQLARF